MKTHTLIKNTGIALFCLLFSSQALSYQTLKCNGITKKWPNNYYQINANPTGFGGSYSHWYNSFNTSISRFNQNPSKFYMSMQMDDDTNVAVANGESELWWATTGCSATAYTIDDTCGVTVEGDIHFSNVPSCVEYEDDMSDKTAFRNYGSGIKRTFETTAIHEIGHTAGLAHENGEYNIMGSDYTHVHANGSALRSYVGEDGGDGLLWIYGARTNPVQDVSAAAWKKVGVSGEYSTHGRTQLYNSSGVALASVDAVNCPVGNTKVAACEQRYTVDMGQVVQYEVTLENNGNNTQEVNVGYYLSTNDTITNQDTLLFSHSQSLGRADVLVHKQTITIPTNLSPNTNYFLGVIVDYDNALSEVSEDNNASYMHIRTSNAGGSSSGGSSSGGSSSGGSSSGGSSSGGSSSGGSSSGGSSSGGSSSSSSGGALSNGQTITGLAATTGNDISGYYIDVPSGASNLVISISAGSGSSGDADLYVKKDSVPTDSSYDCRPYQSGSNETCGGSGNALTTSQGRFYIRLKAYSSFTNVNLTASYTAGGSSSGGSSSGGSSSGGSSSGGSSSGGSGGSIVNACATESAQTASAVSDGDAICLAAGTHSGSIRYHYIHLPSGANSITIRTDHGSGNGTLYYKASNWASSSSYDQSSSNASNTESITVNNLGSGYHYISFQGAQSGATLLVEVQ